MSRYDAREGNPEPVAPTSDTVDAHAPATADLGAADLHLLAELRQALGPLDAPPPGVLHAARGAFAWRDVDREIETVLAEVEYDSVDTAQPVGIRATTASPRLMTFTGGGLTLEVEVDQGTLHGQVLPAQQVEVEVCRPGGAAQTVTPDEAGRFTAVAPPGPLRLRCRLLDRPAPVSTGWLLV